MSIHGSYAPMPRFLFMGMKPFSEEKPLNAPPNNAKITDHISHLLLRARHVVIKWFCIVNILSGWILVYVPVTQDQKIDIPASPTDAVQIFSIGMFATRTQKHSIQIPPVPYCKYPPASVIKNGNAAMYWDGQVITDRAVNANKPDIGVLNWQNKAIEFVDVIILLKQNTQIAYSNKIAKYTERAQDMKSMYNIEKVTIIPIVMSCTGVMPKIAIKGLNYLEIHNILEKVQKAVLLSTVALTRAFWQYQ
uniref:Uncharacterized protein n=1 Tax=Glossina austeni TaxID=7395 RepID=A0A1A9UM71_GLOAU